MEEGGINELRLKESKVLRRVPKDQLVEMNLGTEEDPKMVKVSKQLDISMREELRKLLT